MNITIICSDSSTGRCVWWPFVENNKEQGIPTPSSSEIKGAIIVAVDANRGLPIFYFILIIKKNEID